MIKGIIQLLFRRNRLSSLSRQFNRPDIETQERNEIGFWPDRNWSRSDPYPPAQALIVSDWNKTKEGRACISYMKAGRPFRPQKGYAHCRLCGARLGSSDMNGPDRKWTYPEKWEHYIEEHSVRPDTDEFIKDATRWSKR